MNGTQQSHLAAHTLPIVRPRTRRLSVPVLVTERSYTAGTETMIATAHSNLYRIFRRSRVVFIEAELPDPDSLMRRLDAGEQEITVRVKLTSAVPEAFAEAVAAAGADWTGRQFD